MAKAVVFLAEGFEEVEAISPIDYLRRAGVEVVTAAIPVNGKSDPLVMGAHKIPVKADMTFDEYIASADGLPDAVVAPGGMPGAANIAAWQRCLAAGGPFADSAALWALRYAMGRLRQTDPAAWQAMRAKMEGALKRTFLDCGGEADPPGDYAALAGYLAEENH